MPADGCSVFSGRVLCQRFGGDPVRRQVRQGACLRLVGGVLVFDGPLDDGPDGADLFGQVRVMQYVFGQNRLVFEYLPNDGCGVAR